MLLNSSCTTDVSVTQKVPAPWLGSHDLLQPCTTALQAAGNSKRGTEPQSRLWSRLRFLQTLAKLMAFFYFFSTEIWLRVNGDEESQLQPGGEEVRAPQNLPFPLTSPASRQPRSRDSLLLCFPPLRRECETLTQVSSLQRSKGWGLPGEPGDGAGGGPREDKSTESGMPVGSSL